MDFATPFVFSHERTSEHADSTEGKVLEMRKYESHVDSKGTRTILQTGNKLYTKPPKGKSSKSALLHTTYFNSRSEITHTELEIWSPYIKDALRTVIDTYPGLTFDTAKCVLQDEPRCLFHYRDELRQYGNTLQDEVAVQHLIFILNHMYTVFQEEMLSYYSLMESPDVTPGLSYDYIWMAFRPGDMVYSEHDSIHRIGRLKEMTKSLTLRGNFWNVEVEYIDFDGEKFGYRTKSLLISHYSGYKPLTDLTVFPLHYLPHRELILEQVLDRGRQFLSLCGVTGVSCHRTHSGSAHSLTPRRITSMDGEEDYYATENIRVVGRIIIDPKKFSEERPTHSFKVDVSDEVFAEQGNVPNLTEQQLLMCSSTIAGFSLSAKRWCIFEIDRTQDFEYDARAFESVVLDQDIKRMIHSLVRTQSDATLPFKDFIADKGRGLILLLHGEPGVGKTLTAESVAEYTRRPLYTITSGDLGTKVGDVETNLGRILELATHWNAVVLIDEADVFLQQRSFEDLERNSLVSVFLRLLEYYDGIMILTTNRIEVFDRAFQSRIHLAVQYPALSFASRRDIWVRFFSKIPPSETPSWLNDYHLDELAQEEINGRQIRNVMRTALALAAAEGKALRVEDIHLSLRTIHSFMKDFSNSRSSTWEAGVNTESGGPQDVQERSKRRRIG